MLPGISTAGGSLVRLDESAVRVGLALRHPLVRRWPFAHQSWWSHSNCSWRASTEVGVRSGAGGAPYQGELRAVSRAESPWRASSSGVNTDTGIVGGIP